MPASARAALVASLTLATVVALVAGGAAQTHDSGQTARLSNAAEQGQTAGAVGNVTTVELTDRTGAEALLQVAAVTPVALIAFPGEHLSSLPPGLGEEALYGTLRVGGEDGILTLIVDRQPDGSERVFIDQGNDESFADETPHRWQGDYAVGDMGQAVLPSMTVECAIDCGDEGNVPVVFKLRRFERERVRGRAGAISVRNGILASVETYRQGEVELAGSKRAIALLPTALAGRYTLFTHPANALVIDLNGDGKLDGRPIHSPERFRLGNAFTIDGRAWKVTEVACDGHTLQIAEIDPQVVARERQRRSGQGPVPGDAAPEFELASIAGETVSLDQYRGKLVLLDFWATWCGPCRQEMPYVKAVYERFHAQGFEIIGVSLDKNADIVRRYTQANNMPWPQILQNRGMMTPLKADYGVRSIPSTFLIDGEGRVLARNLRGNRLLETVERVLTEGDGRSD